MNDSLSGGMGNASRSSSPYLSVVVPFFNEEASVPILYQRLVDTLNEQGIDYELIFVDDGSHDGTLRELRNLPDSKNPVQIIKS